MMLTVKLLGTWVILATVFIVTVATHSSSDVIRWVGITCLVLAVLVFLVLEFISRFLGSEH